MLHELLGVFVFEATDSTDSHLVRLRTLPRLRHPQLRVIHQPLLGRHAVGPAGLVASP